MLASNFTNNKLLQKYFNPMCRYVINRFLQISEEVSFLDYNFINKETPAQVFSCKFCEIFRSTYFTEHLRTTAFEIWKAVIVNGWKPYDELCYNEL